MLGIVSRFLPVVLIIVQSMDLYLRCGVAKAEPRQSDSR